MPDRKIAIVINDHTVGVMDEAAEIWPELAGNRSALFRKVAADWQRNRKENGGRSTRIERRILALEAEIAGLKTMIQELKHDPTDYTDHA